jgi:hypothetical protein
MTFKSSSSSQNSPWSSPSAEWLRQRDAIVIESHKKNSQKLSFNSSPESKHTATCNGADELAFGDLGRCSGSL